MNRRVLVINSSSRIGGNTELLAGAFAAGVQDRGGEVIAINLRQHKINPCIGCYQCLEKKGDPCIQKDDMHLIYKAYNETDTLVFASPLYFWTFNAQMMAAVNRLFADSAARGMKVPPKDCVLLIAADDAAEENFAMIQQYYTGLLERLGWTDQGMILAGGVNLVGDIKGTHWLEDARKLGASL